jgi:peptidoglycan/xylan/chitin deacetylase (PgdA/CDA1 family)
MFLKKKSWVQKEIQQTEEILESTVGKHSCGFRPPYGCFDFRTLKVIAESGLKCVLWNTDSKDWKSGTAASVEHRIIRSTQNGSILLFHNNKHTENRLQIYLPAILDTLLGKGFIFNTLPL